MSTWLTLNDVLELDENTKIWCVSSDLSGDFTSTVKDIKSTIGNFDWTGVKFGKIEESKKPKYSEEKFDRYYNKLVELVKPLYRWYDIDKVKTYSVFVWTKDALKNDGWNVFDINYDGLCFYKEDEYNECDIPVGAFPVIRAIQNHLKLGKDIGMYV